jgi:hypothetical protein
VKKRNPLTLLGGVMKLVKIVMISCILGSAITACTSSQQTTQDCSQLNAKEQAFAEMLSSSNKAKFCSEFSSTQRSKAMSWTGKKDENGNMMSPDDAVKKAAKDMNNNGY